MRRHDPAVGGPVLPRAIERRLSAYLDGELSPKDVAAIEARLAIDPVAAAYLEDLQLLSNGLACDEVDRRAAQSIRAQLRSKLRQPTPARGRSLRRWAWPSLAIATVFAVMVSVAGTSRWLPWQGTGSVAGAPVSIEAVSQQYSLALDALGRPTP